MSEALFSLCPGPPAWRVDWTAVVERFDWAAALGGAPHDPVFHAEGDVAVHTRMVCEALAESAGFRALAAPQRGALFAAALLHDVAKPACSHITDAGRVTAPGHSARGARMARAWLFGQATDFATREAIANLVRLHELPFFAIDRDDCRRRVYYASQLVRCDHLALLAEADGRGRICRDPGERERLLDNVALFAAYCGEHECLDRPRAFPTTRARFEYFRTPGRDPDYPGHDDSWGEVVVMAGLPAAGKDTWLAAHRADLPVISLDRIRGQLGVDPDQPQGRVAAAAREQARAALRARRGFAWNATNLSRTFRQRLVGLCTDYRARVRIVYLEAPAAELRQRNRARRQPVPQRVLDRMMSRFTVPDCTEAELVECQVDGLSSAPAGN